jgi:hypothetical protein
MNTFSQDLRYAVRMLLSLLYGVGTTAIATLSAVGALLGGNRDRRLLVAGAAGERRRSDHRAPR